MIFNTTNFGAFFKALRCAISYLQTTDRMTLCWRVLYLRTKVHKML